MFIATVIVSALLALVLLASAASKLSRQAALITQLTGLGVPASVISLLGALEIAGALGLVAGLFWAPIGIAAAIGVIAYFLGAVIAHLRARNYAVAPAAVLGLVAVTALVLRVITK